MDKSKLPPLPALPQNQGGGVDAHTEQGPLPKPPADTSSEPPSNQASPNRPSLSRTRRVSSGLNESVQPKLPKQNPELRQRPEMPAQAKPEGKAFTRNEGVADHTAPTDDKKDVAATVIGQESVDVGAEVASLGSAKEDSKSESLEDILNTECRGFGAELRKSSDEGAKKIYTFKSVKTEGKIGGGKFTAESVLSKSRRSSRREARTEQKFRKAAKSMEGKAAVEYMVGVLKTASEQGMTSYSLENGDTVPLSDLINQISQDPFVKEVAKKNPDSRINENLGQITDKLEELSKSQVERATDQFSAISSIAVKIETGWVTEASLMNTAIIQRMIPKGTLTIDSNEANTTDVKERLEARDNLAKQGGLRAEDLLNSYSFLMTSDVLIDSCSNALDSLDLALKAENLPAKQKAAILKQQAAILEFACDWRQRRYNRKLCLR